MSYVLPVEMGIEDEIMDALVLLLTDKCQTAISDLDVSRMAAIKVGPRQAPPESVYVMIHENDPDTPSSWPHQPLTLQGGFTGRPNSQVSTGRVMIGGGSMHTAAFTIEIEVFGLYFPTITGVNLERGDVSKVATVVANRVVKSILEAGPKVGRATAITDSFGKRVVDGPYLGESWTDPEPGEALLVRKLIRIWYKISQAWDTDDW